MRVTKTLGFGMERLRVRRGFCWDCKRDWRERLLCHLLSREQSEPRLRLARLARRLLFPTIVGKRGTSKSHATIRLADDRGDLRPPAGAAAAAWHHGQPAPGHWRVPDVALREG